MTYELKLEQFQGPLDKLLELIEEKKMDISEVSLAQITDDFVSYVRGLEEVGHDFLAGFLVVASRLLLIKSRTLLPEFQLTPDEEADIKDLEDRLKIYRDFKQAENHLKSSWSEGKRLFVRDYLMGQKGTSVFYPPKGVGAGELKRSLELIGRNLERFIEEGESIKDSVISIEEKVGEIMLRFQEATELSVKSISHKKTRSEIIALFLAILHMARDELVMLEQKKGFDDIIVRKKHESTNSNE